MKRWIALLIGIIALAAGFVQLRRMAEHDVPPTESISAASHARLDDIVRRATSAPPSEQKPSADAHQIPRSEPQASGEVHQVPRSEPQASGEVHKTVDEASK